MRGLIILVAVLLSGCYTIVPERINLCATYREKMMLDEHNVGLSSCLTLKVEETK